MIFRLLLRADKSDPYNLTVGLYAQACGYSLKVTVPRKLTPWSDWRFIAGRVGGPNATFPYRPDDRSGRD